MGRAGFEPATLGLKVNGPRLPSPPRCWTTRVGRAKSARRRLDALGAAVDPLLTLELPQRTTPPSDSSDSGDGAVDTR